MSQDDAFGRLRGAFRWEIPEKFNIAEAICDRWAEPEPDRIAILTKRPGATLEPTTYGELRAASHALAAGLAERGVGRGDRVAVLLPQGPEAAVAHLAVSRLAAVATPLALAFGPDAVSFRLTDSGARAIVTNAAGLAKLRAVEEPPSDLVVVSTDGADGDALDYRALLARGGEVPPADTTPDDPALMIYTSGTTGPPKGALHGGRVLLGHVPGFRLTHDGFPRAGDLGWTPADWAWAGGLLNLMMPCLHDGVPVVAQPVVKFDPEAAFALIAEAGVRNAFIPPTALRLMAQSGDPRERHPGMALRSLVAAGERLGEASFDWARRAFGVPVNEVYGQTECNYVLASFAHLGVSKAGFTGKPTPGHEVALFRQDGTRCAPGEQGEIRVRRPDPVMFLEYWDKPEATAEKFSGDWLLTGDQAVTDADGYFRFLGRDDDVITSAGYRIGPSDIEDCLSRHPAVALAAVVGKPDEMRTEIVKAFVQLTSGVSGDEALAEELKLFVRERLSHHEYPREIEFVAELPLTTTGKIIRRALRERG
ncbi:AMP-binding protein [Chenggangzhangella methanolivorans]|uniref:AMP-binding protein n=1 Tax=Chenggangzhangella methanolivorans TaxID=1437009 RepID=UPI003621DA85